MNFSISLSFSMLYFVEPKISLKYAIKWVVLYIAGVTFKKDELVFRGYLINIKTDM